MTVLLNSRFLKPSIHAGFQLICGSCRWYQTQSRNGPKPSGFFCFPSENLISSCDSVRDSVTHSGGMRGHIKGHEFKKWGHFQFLPPAIGAQISPSGAPGGRRGAGLEWCRRVQSLPCQRQGVPLPPETCAREKTANRSVSRFDRPDFLSPPPPAYLRAGSQKKSKTETCDREEKANRSVSGWQNGAFLRAPDVFQRGQRGQIAKTHVSPCQH